MSYTLRTFAPSDIPEAMTMWSSAPGVELDESDSPDRILSFLQSNGGLSFVSVDGHGHLAGTILCSHDTRRGYIYHLAVDESCRRAGIGGQLVGASLDALSKQGIHKCHIHVMRSNPFAESFWGARGWMLGDDIYTFSSLTRE
jgi:ribosomal protein S18 acetylase RimI-like enzyme